ncbi:MAG: signal peptide peptidase SppA [Candidatus Melainabacteria bacterium]|nr:signal peptide peptidase SppA [Candidatus Melainabacteria bacterium]
MSITYPKVNHLIVWILLIVCILAIPVGLIASWRHGDQYELTEMMRSPLPFEDRLVVLKLTGVLVESADSSIFSPVNPVEVVKRKLRKALKDKHVKGILLRIDSPGGTVATSQEIYSYIMELRHKGVPAVACMSDVAASGGYYVACACERIVAQPGTITGSIGVIMNLINIRGLGQKLGIEPQVVKSGQFKDIGSPMRPMTEDERKILQTIILDAYEQFVDVVAAGRKMPKDTVKKIADGRIYLGRQARELGLVDELGGYEAALACLQKLSKDRFGHKVDLKVDEGPKPGPLTELLGLVDGQAKSNNPFHTGLFLNPLANHFHKIPLWLMD